VSEPARASSDYDPLTLAGTGRHLSKDELRTWTRFLDAGRLLEEILARHLSQRHAMTHSDYEVLVRLDGSEGRMRMATLANQVVSSSQKLTKTADRLERRGWIRRDPVVTDARGLEAVLLPAGRQALAAAAGEHADLVKQFLLDGLTVEEQLVIAESMDRLSTHMRLHRSGGPCPQCDAPAPSSTRAALAPGHGTGDDAGHGFRD
jgi:DNA-binding MarR family transcriptional regulator